MSNSFERSAFSWPTSPVTLRRTPQGKAGQRLLAILVAVEDTLMAVGALSSDFATIVAAPRR